MARKTVQPQAKAEKGVLISAAKTIGKAAGKIAVIVDSALHRSEAKPVEPAKPASKPASKKKKPAAKTTAVKKTTRPAASKKTSAKPKKTARKKK